MSSLDFSSYSRQDLERVLSVMKLYQTSLKQVGKRAKLYDPKETSKEILRIQYASGLDTAKVLSYAKSCVNQYFPEYHWSDDTLSVLENPNLKWGIRVFYGDDMVDVSFQKFENALR